MSRNLIEVARADRARADQAHAPSRRAAPRVVGRMLSLSLSLSLSLWLWLSLSLSLSACRETRLVVRYPAQRLEGAFITGDARVGRLAIDVPEGSDPGQQRPVSGTARIGAITATLSGSFDNNTGLLSFAGTVPLPGFGALRFVDDPRDVATVRLPDGLELPFFLSLVLGERPRPSVFCGLVQGGLQGQIDVIHLETRAAAVVRLSDGRVSVLTGTVAAGALSLHAMDGVARASAVIDGTGASSGLFSDGAGGSGSWAASSNLCIEPGPAVDLDAGSGPDA
ncbi:MAG: hypothetical protein IT384_26200 [Deltaproteobacteria bacterium]|nr:hypothetical protein [Deltaproteobacteria bacterium]